ncbi:hypothetical protein Tco_1157640 [Tanacetum coccineum]
MSKKIIVRKRRKPQAMNHYAEKCNYASAKRNNKEDEDDRRKEEAAFNICSSYLLWPEKFHPYKGYLKKIEKTTNLSFQLYNFRGNKEKGKDQLIGLRNQWTWEWFH